MSSSAPDAIDMFWITELTSKSAVISWRPPIITNDILRRYDVWLESKEQSPSCVARKVFLWCATQFCQDVDPVKEAIQVMPA